MAFPTSIIRRIISLIVWRSEVNLLIVHNSLIIQILLLAITSHYHLLLNTIARVTCDIAIPI